MERGWNVILAYSFVPRLSRKANIYRWDRESPAWYLLRKHDVIKIGTVTFCALFNQLCFNARCVIFDARQLDTCSKLPATFALSPVLSRRYAHEQVLF